MPMQPNCVMGLLPCSLPRSSCTLTCEQSQHWVSGHVIGAGAFRKAYINPDIQFNNPLPT